MRRGAAIAGLVAMLIAAASAASGARPLIAAHRGGAALAPENSLAAFRNAIALGADILEFDLHLTRDGEVVVIHDPVLDRTTTATGAVRDRTLAELASVRLKARDGTITGERVPVFADLLDLARDRPVELLPEIKIGPDGKSYPQIEEKVLALLRARDLLGRVTVQAFQVTTIRRLHELGPGLRTMLLIGQRQVSRERAPDAVDEARAVGATDLGIDHRLADARLVAAAREAKIRLSVWTVNDEPDIRRMLELGVDVIMSDRPDLVKRLAGR